MADTLDRNAVIQELARAIAAVASGDDEDARVIITGIATGYAKERQTSLPGLPSPPPALTAELIKKAAVGRLFSYWQEKCDHRAAKMTPDRARLLLSRLRDGYTEAEIRRAIEGAAAAAYVDKESGKKFDDLTLICRTGSKLEDFIDRGVRVCGEVVREDAGPQAPVEVQIGELRIKMSGLKTAGRDTEYEQAATELSVLLGRRKERKTA